MEAMQKMIGQMGMDGQEDHDDRGQNNAQEKSLEKNRHFGNGIDIRKGHLGTKSFYLNCIRDIWATKSFS